MPKVLVDGGSGVVVVPSLPPSLPPLKSVKASSQTECCSKCSADAQCSAGVFVAKDKNCWIKSFEDMKHKVKARVGMSTVACVTGKPPPAPSPGPSIVCTAANDSPAAWSGDVVLSIAPLTAQAGAQPSWSKTLTVEPVQPGEARRFLVLDAGAAAASCPTGTQCWLYGQQQQGSDNAATAVRADIGVPLQPLKSLVTNKQLTAANVNASVSSTNATAASIFWRERHASSG